MIHSRALSISYNGTLETHTEHVVGKVQVCELGEVGKLTRHSPRKLIEAEIEVLHVCQISDVH